MQGVGLHIRQYRLRKGYSVVQLAQKIGVSTSTLRDWEEGRKIQGEPYSAIAEALGVSVSEILFGSEYKASIAEDLEAIEAIVKKLKSKL